MGSIAFCDYGLMLAGGITSYHFGMSMKKEQPMERSEACAVVLGYKHYKTAAAEAKHAVIPMKKYY